MTSTEHILSLSFPFWSKLKSLCTNKQSQFITSVYKFITDKTHQIPYPQSLHDKSLCFLTHKDLVVLLAIYKLEAEKSIIKFIDYLPIDSEQAIKKNLDENKKIVTNSKTIKLDDNSYFQNWGNLDEFINLNYQFKSKHLTIEQHDFWCYVPEIEKKNNYELLSTQQDQV